MCYGSIIRPLSIVCSRILIFTWWNRGVCQDVKEEERALKIKKKCMLVAKARYPGNLIP